MYVYNYELRKLTDPPKTANSHEIVYKKNTKT